MVEKLTIALIGGALLALFLYAFRHRQLYVVMPRLFSVSSITSNGQIVEIRVFNRSRLSEEDVRVTLSNNRRYEIVASTDSTIRFSDFTLHIPRLPPVDDCSVLLMVEGGSFTKAEIAGVSSKTTKGKLVSTLNDVLPNAGTAVLTVLLFLLVLAGPIYGIEFYKTSAKEYRLAALSSAVEKGWRSLEEYSESELRVNYKDHEFPVFQKAITRNGDDIAIVYGVINKSASPLGLYAIPSSPFKDERHVLDKLIVPFPMTELFPGDIQEITVGMYWPVGKAGEAEVRFTFSDDTDPALSIVNVVRIEI